MFRFYDGQPDVLIDPHTRNVDSIADRLFSDDVFGLVDQDAFTRHLLLTVDTETEFADAITHRIDIPQDTAFAVFRTYLEHGLDAGLEAFDDATSNFDLAWLA